MVEQHLCTFCGEQIEPGTGKMYVKKDGTVWLFCTNKCYKNMIELGRIPRRTTWTRAAKREKEITLAAAAPKEEAAAPEQVFDHQVQAQQDDAQDGVLAQVFHGIVLRMFKFGVIP